MPRLREHRDDLRALISLTAEAREIGSIFVEKDFWVTEVLRAATAPVGIVARDGSHHGVRTIFKGGTSLSRIYGIIERFSEDVDLLIGFPPCDASIGAKDRVLKSIRDSVTAHLGIGDENAVADGLATKGVKRNTRYRYSSLGYEHSGQLTSGVLLEMGCRGGTFPTQTHPLRSMVAEHAIEVLGEDVEAWDEFAAFDVEVLGPARTLLEKLSLLHDAVSRSTDDDGEGRLMRSGRHLYDVHNLLRDDSVLEDLRAAGQAGVADLCADIEQHSSDAGFSYTPRPTGGYGQSALVAVDHQSKAPLQRGYDAAMSLVYGDRPSFEECVETIRAQSIYL